MATKCGPYKHNDVVEAYISWLQGYAASNNMAVTEDMTVSPDMAAKFVEFFKKITGVEIDEKTLQQVMVDASSRWNVRREHWGTRPEPLAVEQLNSKDYVSFREAAKILEKKLNAQFYQTRTGGDRVSRSLGFVQVSHANRPTYVFEELGMLFLRDEDTLRKIEGLLQGMAGRRLSMAGYKKLLFRAAYLNPTWLKSNYPILYDIVVSAAGEHHEALVEYANNARKLLSLPPTERAKELVVDSSMSVRDTAEEFERPPGYSKGLLSRILTHFSDRHHEAIQAYRYMRKMKGIKDPPARRDFEVQLRLMNGRDRRFAQVVALGVPDPETGQFLTGGGLSWLVQPLSNAGSNVDEVASDAILYMTAKRAIELHKLHTEREAARALLEKEAKERSLSQKEIEEGKAAPEGLPQKAEQLTGLGSDVSTELEEATKIIEDLTTKYGDNVKHFEEAHKRYVEWSRSLLHYAVKRGYLSRSDFHRMTSGSESYVSLMRMMIDPFSDSSEEDVLKNLLETKGSTGKSLLHAREVLHRLKGSSRMIQNPYVNLMHMTKRIMDEVDRNATKAAFLMPMLPNGVLPFDAASASETNLEEAIEFNSLMFGSIARPVSSTAAMSGQVIEVRLPTKDGEVVTTRWHVPDPDLAAALGPEASINNSFVKGVAAIITMVRNAYTKNPQFFLRNLFRDVQSAQLVYGTMAPIHASVMSMVSEAREMWAANNTSGNRSSIWRQMELWGGGQFGWYLTNSAAYKRMLREAIDKDGSVIVPVDKLGGFFQKVESIMASGEAASRLSTFNKHKQEYISKHKNDPDFEISDAYYYAAYKSRSLLDFAIAGSTIKILNRFIPFLNANVQGLKVEWRTITTPKGFARVMAYNMIGAAIESMWNEFVGATEGLATLPMWRKLTFWNFKVGNIWIMVPKPFGLFSSPSYLFQTTLLKWRASQMDKNDERRLSIDMALQVELARGLNPQSLYRNLYYAISPLDPDLFAPPGISPLTFNYDVFRDRTIVPEYEVDQPVEERKGTKYASAISRMLSEAIGKTGIGVDPRVLDVAAGELFGWYGKLAVGLTRRNPDILPIAGLGFLGRSAGSIAPQSAAALQMDRRFQTAGLPENEYASADGMSGATLAKRHMTMMRMLQDQYRNAKTAADKEEVAERQRLFSAAVFRIWLGYEEQLSKLQKLKKKISDGQ